MTAAPFSYHVPASLDEAVRMLAEATGEARLLAGGQSLVPAMAARLARPAHLIDLNRIARARKPTISAARLRIPPLMRHADFAAGVADGPLGPLLAELASAVGPLPVRLRGTFCGALAEADAAAEWCLAAVVLNADVVVRSHARGVRNVRADAFFETMLTTVLADDEMIVEVQIPLLPAPTRTGFAKIARLSGGFGAALALVTHEVRDGTMRRVRIGVSGVEPVPRRIGAAELVLEGHAPVAARLAAAAEAAAESVDPAESDAEDALYKRDLTRAAVLGALERSLP